MSIDVFVFGLFQSTLSMRRATRGVEQLRRAGISIHALHEESDQPDCRPGGRPTISIHALHEESDLTINDPDAPEIISIHALHEESDTVTTRSLRWPRNFNPRSP